MKTESAATNLDKMTNLEVKGLFEELVSIHYDPVATNEAELRDALTVSPELAAIAMSGSSLIVAANALLLERTNIEGLK